MTARLQARLVTRTGADESEWLAARRTGIGASEIAAVMGISPYDSPFSLFWKKRNGWETPVNDEMSTGTFLEATIAEWFIAFGDPLENLTVRRGGLYAHPERTWQLATPDRLLYVPCAVCDGVFIEYFPDHEERCTNCVDGIDPVGGLEALLECKWVAFSWDGWGEPGTDDVPVNYRAQAMQQLDVMGVDKVFICALGPGGFRVYVIRRDENDLRAMREEGRRFMQRLASDRAPDVDEHTATMAILKRLNPDIVDAKVEVPAYVASGFIRAKAYAAKAKKLEAKYNALVRYHLGKAKHATTGGRIFASRSNSDQLSLKDKP